jgi:hypothetical protein
MNSDVPSIPNANRATKVLRNTTMDWIAICAAMATPRPVTENILTEMLVIALIGIRAADRAIAAKEVG